MVNREKGAVTVLAVAPAKPPQKSCLMALSALPCFGAFCVCSSFCDAVFCIALDCCCCCCDDGDGGGGDGDDDDSVAAVAAAAVDGAILNVHCPCCFVCICVQSAASQVSLQSLLPSLLQWLILCGSATNQTKKKKKNKRQTASPGPPVSFRSARLAVLLPCGSPLLQSTRIVSSTSAALRPSVHPRGHWFSWIRTTSRLCPAGQKIQRKKPRTLCSRLKRSAENATRDHDDLPSHGPWLGCFACIRAIPEECWFRWQCGFFFFPFSVIVIGDNQSCRRPDCTLLVTATWIVVHPVRVREKKQASD